MIKECKVILSNYLVTVIEYDGKQIQLPSINCDKKYVKVIKDGDMYTVVSDEYAERKSKNRKKKQQ